MVVLKKPFITVGSCNLPNPIPAKIPRPKITKYSSITAQAETPDEVNFLINFKLYFRKMKRQII